MFGAADVAYKLTTCKPVEKRQQPSELKLDVSIQHASRRAPTADAMQRHRCAAGLAWPLTY